MQNSPKSAPWWIAYVTPLREYFFFFGLPAAEPAAPPQSARACKKKTNKKNVNIKDKEKWTAVDEPAAPPQSARPWN